MAIERPIFVIGCNNSGTTILWQALKQHPLLSGPDVEGQDLEDLPMKLRHFLGKATFRLWAHPQFKLSYYLTEADFRQDEADKTAEVYGRFVRPGTRFIEKTPSNVGRAQLLQAYFPDAYFVPIVRNGYAVAEGTVRKRKDDPDRPQFAGLFTTIEEAAEQWFRANFFILSQGHFLKRYLDPPVKYEDLVADPESVLYRVLQFCDLPTEGFPIPTFRQGLNDEQIARLSLYEIEVVTRIAGPALFHFGYEILQRELRW